MPSVVMRSRVLYCSALLTSATTSLSVYRMALTAPPKQLLIRSSQNSSKFTSGFHALLLGQDDDIPYYDTWNIIQPSANSQTRLAVLIEGHYGQFFVDGHRVFQRMIDDLPNYTVAVGTTVLANNLQDAANCTFKDVVFRAKLSS